MRSLSIGSLVVALVVLGVVRNTYAEQVDDPVLIFGKPYIRVSSLAGSRAYEMKGADGLVVQVKEIRARNEAVAMAFIGDRLALFKSVFETKRVDYPGQHSRVIECPAEYKPQFAETNREDYYVAYFMGFANQNKVAGACLPDLIAYRHMYGFVYCKKQAQLFELDHYSNPKLNAPSQFLEALSCEP